MHILNPLLLICLYFVHSVAFNIMLVTPLNPQETDIPKRMIFNNSQLQQPFNDSQYDNYLTCTNNLFTVVQFNITDVTQGGQSIVFKYTDLTLSTNNFQLSATPNLPNPSPSLLLVDDLNKQFIIKGGCLTKDETDVTNYYNKLIVTIKIDSNSSLISSKDAAYGQPTNFQAQKSYRFSLLYNCQYKGRNKRFQLGYLILTLINAMIIIGVALHSRIWSIRYKRKPLCFQLKWYRFLILMISIVCGSVAIYLYANTYFKEANRVLTYIGFVIGWVFTIICANQIFFLISSCKRQIKISQKITVRICDILSFITATILIILNVFFQNWILFDIISICICVGAIKLFQFGSMKQGFISMAISVVVINATAITMHWLLERSYNQYANQLASSLFLVVPDLIKNLFKKCSWLPIIDIVVPGVFLSYLRGYDQNYSTGWGGVYTVVGNVSFLIGTIIWISIEGGYYFAVPFCLVTYPCLMLGVSLIAYKRNQLATLWSGRFNGPHNQFSERLVEIDENRTTFGKMVGTDILDEMKLRNSE